MDNNFDGYHNTSLKTQRPKGNTIIINDVWIGFEALIMPRVTIGDGAIVAACAVVTKDIGPYEIWGGNPTRLIKKRFIESDIQKLLQIKWWDWEAHILKNYLDYLRSSDIKALWQKYQSDINVI